VVEAVADPEAPPIPPHITLQQGKSLLEAVLKGDPARGEIIKQAWRQALDGC
jgi:pyruvate dehydrogenase (quinone)